MLSLISQSRRGIVFILKFIFEVYLKNDLFKNLCEINAEQMTIASCKELITELLFIIFLVIQVTSGQKK